MASVFGSWLSTFCKLKILKNSKINEFYIHFKFSCSKIDKNFNVSNILPNIFVEYFRFKKEMITFLLENAQAKAKHAFTAAFRTRYHFV